MLYQTNVMKLWVLKCCVHVVYYSCIYIIILLAFFGRTSEKFANVKILIAYFSIFDFSSKPFTRSATHLTARLIAFKWDNKRIYVSILWNKYLLSYFSIRTNLIIFKIDPYKPTNQKSGLETQVVFWLRSNKILLSKRSYYWKYGFRGGGGGFETKRVYILYFFSVRFV